MVGSLGLFHSYSLRLSLPQKKKSVSHLPLLLILMASSLPIHSHLQILAGNVDTITASHNDLEPPIVARLLRIIPHSIFPRIVCLRFDLYGCLGDGGSGNVPMYKLSHPPDLISLSAQKELGPSWWKAPHSGILVDGSLGKSDLPSVGKYGNNIMI